MRNPRNIRPAAAGLRGKGADIRGQVVVRKGAEVHEADGAPWLTAEDTPAYVLGEIDARWVRVSLHGTRPVRVARSSVRP